MVAARRKRKTIKRTYKRRPIPRSLVTRSMLKCTRVTELTPFTITATTDAWTTTNYNFRLVDLPSFTDFTNLFDSYKITGVKITWMPRYFDSSMGGANAYTPATATPNIWLCTDDDSDSNLTSQLQAMQVDRARMVKNPWKPFSMFVRPKFTREVKVFAGIAGANPGSGWLDTANSGVYHYGITIGASSPGYAAGASFNPMVYDVYAKYYLQFREPV